MATTDNGDANATSGFDDFQQLCQSLEPLFTDVTGFRLLDLPAELRSKIYEEYFLIDSTQLDKERHYDNFANSCCVWEYPDALIVCDKWEAKELSHPNFPRFLPAICFVNRQLRTEVAVHLLRKVKQVVIKYYPNCPIKMVKYMTAFLDSLGPEGFEKIQDVVFPHIHWYTGDSEQNPDVQFMLRCPNLRTVGLTFHASVMSKPQAEGSYHRKPRPLTETLDHFGLRSILGCKQLRHVYLDGIMPRTGFYTGFHPLQTLWDLGLWIKDGFAARGQAVVVHYHCRLGAFRGRVEEEIL